MIYEMIAEIKIPELHDGIVWYSPFFNREPDLLHDGGFAEWSVAPGCGFRLVQGQTDSKNSVLRFGVYNLETELKRLKNEIGIEIVDLKIKTEQSMQTRWCTLNDPWMNKIGLYEYLNEKHKSQVILSIQDDWNTAGPA
ncbi:VOC family protein [Bacillus infantis]|uniref:VOC family protein n=1 Tax=Bacillus infantis TaxID=324767 RepID=UPI003CEEDB95